MCHSRPSSWVLVACLVSLSVQIVYSDSCTEAPEETVGACSACASALRIDMDTCCSVGRILDMCKNLPKLIAEGQKSMWPEEDTWPYRDNNYEEDSYSDEVDEADKRARPFLGKRSRYFGGNVDEQMDDEDKRARPILGKKQHSLMAKRADDLDAFLKRARPFLGKKARPFLGKRDGDENDRLAEMLKRARPFLGKKARPFLGKRDDETESLADVLKRARPFLGKKARPFLG